MRPLVLRTISETRRYVEEMRARGLLGFVPTMGALHAGHGALMERARAECANVVVSIFVNPIQFDRRDDYLAYAVDLEADLAFCQQRGVDAVLAPSPDEMYPSEQSVFVEVGGVADHMEGKFRPGHFRGVATVVAKLFHIVPAHRAYFGEKDAQQLAVIQAMAAGLNMAIEIVPVPTVRDPDGLALSSRNRRLSADERAVAPRFHQALEHGRRLIVEGCRDAHQVKQQVLQRLDSFRIDYIEVADPVTMQPVDHIAGPVRIAGALWLGNTRLIDNVLCG